MTWHAAAFRYGVVEVPFVSKGSDLDRLKLVRSLLLRERIGSREVPFSSPLLCNDRLQIFAKRNADWKGGGEGYAGEECDEECGELHDDLMWMMDCANGWDGKAKVSAVLCLCAGYENQTGLFFLYMGPTSVPLYT